MKNVRGLFITGTDTDVGKTYVTALIARRLAAAGHRVGVYKPVASGCRREGGRLVSDDAAALWEAAGRPGELERVSPQCFEAALAPHLAARAEGREVDPDLLRSGIAYWRERSDIVLVEGAGGLFSPVSDGDLVADLASDFGHPLLVVARNALGTINHTLLTLRAAATFEPRLAVAGLILNDVGAFGTDQSVQTNHAELSARTNVPLLAHVGWQETNIGPAVDWFALARS